MFELKDKKEEKEVKSCNTRFLLIKL